MGAYGPAMVVVGVAPDAEEALGRLFDVLPLPESACVIVAVQGAGLRAHTRILASGPTTLRVAWGPQPLEGGAVWLVPPGAVARVEEGVLELVDHSERGPLVELFASAAHAGALGVLLGDLGEDADAVARAFGDGVLLRPDLRAFPRPLPLCA